MKRIAIFSLVAQMFFVCYFSLVWAAGESSQQSSIEIQLVRKNFASMLNSQHPGNRIGYRFFEHSPISYGEVPLSNLEAAIDTSEITAFIKELTGGKNVFVYQHKIEKDEEWTEQTWTYYLQPVSDGVELWWVVETFKEGLPAYYGVQQCFRLSGETNEDWRKKIACTPAFSEYDLWAQQKQAAKKTSLSFVVRDEKWQPLPAVQETVGARTPLGVAIDYLRSDGHPMATVGPYQAKMLDPADNGLVTRSSEDDSWVCGIYWENTSHVTDHHPADCLHSIVNIGNIPPRSKRMLHGKIYWFKGSKDDLTAHFNNDFCEDSMRGKLRIAASQFPVSEKIQENANWIKKYMRLAKIKGADIVHFPECALSGYGGSDVKDFDSFDWELCHSEIDSILTLAKSLKMWVILGSSHQLSSDHKPHNSLYVINRAGKIIDRYDKRFCTSGDLKYYSPGNHFVVFEVNGVKCGLLICYDIRFPELYREYRKLGVDVIFDSFYNARHKQDCIHPKIMPVTAQARAATNYFYISLTNASAPYSWPCHFILPNGLIEQKLPANRPGLLISDIDISKEYYDASRPYRLDAISGKLNSGETVDDPRSKQRTGY